MASALYPKAKEDFLSGNINLVGDTIKVLLVDNTYVYSASHEDLADVSAGARVASSSALTTPTVTSGVFDADDLVMSGITGDDIYYLIIYKDTGVEATSRLILFVDTFVSGIPNTPNGADRTIEWNNGTSKIFKL